MELRELIRQAEQVVASAQRRLPPPLQELASRVPVAFHDWPSADILEDEFEPDILGLFVGSPHGHETGDHNDLPGHILLFLGNLWDFAEGDAAVFREEVRVTYLHELGHYLGWDESDLDERGLA